MRIEDLIEEMKANVWYNSHIQLNATTQSELLAHLAKQDLIIEDLREQVRELEVENADAWSQVFYG